MSQIPSHDPSTQPDDTTPDAPAQAGCTPRFNAARDNKGRFMKGNPGGPGNPFARQVAKLRSVLVNTVREEDMKRIAEDLVVQAKFGNMAAIKLLFLYVLGKPVHTVNPDTLDIEEWQQIFRPIPQIMREVPEAIMALSAEKACDVVQAAQPRANKALNNALKMPTEEIEKMAHEWPNDEDVHKEGAAPSPNGGSLGPRRLPPWLAKIAARLHASGHPSARKRRRRA